MVVLCANVYCRFPANVPPCQETTGRTVPSSGDCGRARGRPMRGCGLCRPSVRCYRDILRWGCIAARSPKTGSG